MGSRTSPLITMRRFVVAGSLILSAGLAWGHVPVNMDPGTSEIVLARWRGVALEVLPLA